MEIRPRPFDPTSQGSYSDAFRSDSSGLAVGLQFRASLLARTPLWILEHDGELWTDKSADSPNYGGAADGIWIVALPWRLNDAEPSSSEAIEFHHGARLAFFKAFRRIVESPASTTEQSEQIAALIAADARFQQICAYHSLDLPRAFFMDRLQQLKGVGARLALTLYNAGLRRPEDVQAAADKELLGLPGIGTGTLQRIRSSIVRSLTAPAYVDVAV